MSSKLNAPQQHSSVCRSDKMRLQAAIFLIATSAVLAGSLAVKSAVFQKETSSSYLELVPLKSLSLSAFTLCMRVATELKGEREVILFAYRTRDFDELNLWRELDGRLAFYLSGEGVFFDVPQLGALETHLCASWDSSSGAATIFMDGKKSLTKIYKKGHNIRSGGKVIIGQDPDSYLGDFDANQSFVAPDLQLSTIVCFTMPLVVDAMWALWSIGAGIYDYFHTSAMEERIHTLENALTIHQFVITALSAGFILLMMYILWRKY
ncbi:pentraxin fusion protein-like [Solea senegalensis]|uniref:Pentraxin fusion protein-like n=1 Tax=Solea senegalensis TaxID=28829 RepID=A0AAV6RJC8_SOLSE|nr:pentraxin fusion protein-like [Solea senegalensis]